MAHGLVFGMHGHRGPRVGLFKSCSFCVANSCQHKRQSQRTPEGTAHQERLGYQSVPVRSVAAAGLKSGCRCPMVNLLVALQEYLDRNTAVLDLERGGRRSSAEGGGGGGNGDAGGGKGNDM